MVGRETRETSLPPALRGAIAIAGEEPPPLPDPAAAIAKALSRPLGAQPLPLFVEPGDRVAVAVAAADETALRILPPVLAAIRSAGPSRIAVRLAKPAPEALDRIRRIAAGAEVGGPVPGSWEAVGVAPGLGPVRIDRELARADRWVLVGEARFDPLAGVGGAPLLLPALAAPETARSIWARAVRAGALAPEARPGLPEGNPVACAIDAALRCGPPTFALQVALQRGGRPAALFAGDLREVQRAAGRFLRRWHGVEVEPADRVVAMLPDDPEADALVALAAAAAASGPGGSILLVAPAGVRIEPRPDDPAGAARAAAIRTVAAARRCRIVGAAHRGAAEAAGLAVDEELEAALAQTDPAATTLLLPDPLRTLPLPKAPIR